jgi:hypothetical protein
MNGRPWTEAEDAEFRRLYPDMRSDDLATHLGRTLSAVYGRAAKLGIAKSDAFLASPDACRLRRGDNPGIPFRFKKGHVPFNKGKHITAGGRSGETRFKPGVKPHTWLPIGSEIWRPDGYLWRKVRDEAPLARHNWIQVHRILWEQLHGPIPEGYVLRFRNGDTRDIREDNLELITRGEHGRRNSMHRLPPEIRQALHTKAALSRAITKLRKEKQA